MENRFCIHLLVATSHRENFCLTKPEFGLTFLILSMII